MSIPLPPTPEVQRARLLEVAEAIENAPPLRCEDGYQTTEGYDQSKWNHSCGTPACIAGWTAVVACPSMWFDLGLGYLRGSDETMFVGEIATTYFGLSAKQADALFDIDACYWPEEVPVKDRFEPTQAEAAAVLRYLADNLDWEPVF